MCRVLVGWKMRAWREGEVWIMLRRCSTVGAVLVAAGWAAFMPVVRAASPEYTLTVVGPYGHVGRQAAALNAAGHVTGQGVKRQAFLWDGTLHSLGAPAGSIWSVGQGISNGDVVAATAQGPNGVRHAYAVTYTNGKSGWIELPGLAGYTLSEAQGITPDGSAIVGTLCPTGDRGCSGIKRPSLAAVWRHSNGMWQRPLLIPAGKTSAGSVGSAVARAGAVTVAAAGNAVWPLHARAVLALTPPPNDTVVGIDSIAHGSGNTFYVAGQTSNPNVGTVTEAVLWTVNCARAGCRQTGRTVLASFGQVFAVNGKGAAVGYSRPNGDGGGAYVIWQRGQETQLPIEGLAINNAGQIAGPRQNPTTFRYDQVALLTPQ